MQIEIGKLFEACQNGELEILKHHIQIGFDVKTADSQGVTALHW
jgi:ankyrin repeat protein